jgi:hypothetical protein
MQRERERERERGRERERERELELELPSALLYVESTRPLSQKIPQLRVYAPH